MSTRPFVRRALSNANSYRKEQSLNWAVLFPSFMLFCLFMAMILALAKDAHAAGLSFKPVVKSHQLALQPKKGKKTTSGRTYWQIADDISGYKNARLTEFQDMLYDRGVSVDQAKIFVAQALQENGALSENRDGDWRKNHYCSIGLAQRNVCQAGYNTMTFRSAFPVWKNYRTQLVWLADELAANLQQYHGNVKLAVVDHNRPASAHAGKDRCIWWSTRVLVDSCPLHVKDCTCYFRDEVSQHLSSLVSFQYR